MRLVESFRVEEYGGYSAGGGGGGGGSRGKGLKADLEVCYLA